MRKNSLTRKEKILRSEDFIRIRKKGSRRTTASFLVYTLPKTLAETKKTKFSSFGLSVSARTGNAVRRNKLKRLLREFFRLNKENWPSPTDILITVKAGNKLQKYDDIKKELSFLFKEGKEKEQEVPEK